MIKKFLRKNYNSNILKDEATYCLYCKGKLVVELEIEKGFHTSCHESVLKERNLSINQIIERFYLLTNGFFRIVNIDDRLNQFNESDFNFIDYLEKNTLYMSKEPSTEYRYLSLENIHSIPYELSFFKDLKVLVITNNHSIILNDYLGLLKQLQVLVLGYVDYISGIEFISELENLVYLRLAGPLAENFIFPETFSNLTNIRFLELESFDSENLVNTIEKFDRLKRLNLSIGIINEPFERMNSLEELRISNVRFKTNFSELFQSPNLKSVSFSNCPFNSLPDSFSPKLLLEKLSLTSCPITELPSSLASVRNLQIINLKSTAVKDLPYNLVNISSLQIDNSHIIEITSEIGNMKELRSLSITNSPVQTIDKSISALKKLKVLNLSGTKITSLPEELEDLSSLEVMNLSNLCLKSIPKSVFKLKNLKILILDSNTQLLDYSDELDHLKHLERLSLKLIPLSESTKKKLQNIFSNNEKVEIIYY